jgi:hypothetical protein
MYSISRSLLRNRRVFLSLIWILLLTNHTIRAQPVSSVSSQIKGADSSTELLIDATTPLVCESLLQAIKTLPLANDLAGKIEDRLHQITASPLLNRNQKSAEINLIRLLHANSHCFLKTVDPDKIDKRLRWEQLSDLLRLHPTTDVTGPLKVALTIIWINYLKEHADRLSFYFKTSHRQAGTESQDAPYIKFQEAFLTPDQASMWLHCQRRFNKRANGWSVFLQNGFLSKAFQFIQFTRKEIDIETALIYFPAPGYGDYQQSIPAISVSLINDTEGIQGQPWNLLYETCHEFGFQVIYPENENLKGELSFVGIDSLYREIFSNPLIPENIAHDLPEALQASGFYPSPQGLKTILALSAQESTMQWNPKLNSQKKVMLRKRFDSILSQVINSVPGSVSSFFLSKEHKTRLERLIGELHKITDPRQEKSREYDFYLWSRETYAFVKELAENHSQMALVGDWFFDLQSLITRLEKEPQTFGLWQINVNHLQEKIDSYKQLRRAFPEIYQNVNNTWIVNRSWLIDALSGRPHARLSRLRTLELIIHTHLRPHYENHMLGDDNDLLYFIAENMAGEMSTFRAAIQKELNEKMRYTLVTDGDLSYYLPYSTQIDWTKKSKTYVALREFIGIHQYYFKEPVQPEKLIKSLCQARSWTELHNLELYQKLMDKGSPIRIFPDIISSLYKQTPNKYARLVTKKSQLF